MNPSEVLIVFSPHSSIQFSCSVRLFATQSTITCQAALSVSNSWSFLKLMSIELVMPSNHLVLCLQSCLQSFPASGSFLVSRLFPSSGQVSLSNSPCNDYSGLISFRIDWFDLLAIHRTLKSLLQHHSSKASIFRLSTFFMI